jgi:protein TonB
VNPDYPREARKNHVQGDVILQATIDKEGNVAGLKVVRGEPILADAAVEAVKQWKYRPYLLNGEAVEVETQLLIKFHM